MLVNSDGKIMNEEMLRDMRDLWQEAHDRHVAELKEPDNDKDDRKFLRGCIADAVEALERIDNELRNLSTADTDARPAES